MSTRIGRQLLDALSTANKRGYAPDTPDFKTLINRVQGIQEYQKNPDDEAMFKQRGYERDYDPLINRDIPAALQEYQNIPGARRLHLNTPQQRAYHFEPIRQASPVDVVKAYLKRQQKEVQKIKDGAIEGVETPDQKKKAARSAVEILENELSSYFKWSLEDNLYAFQRAYINDIQKALDEYSALRRTDPEELQPGTMQKRQTLELILSRFVRNLPDHITPMNDKHQVGKMKDDPDPDLLRERTERAIQHLQSIKNEDLMKTTEAIERPDTTDPTLAEPRGREYGPDDFLRNRNQDRPWYEKIMDHAAQATEDLGATAATKIPGYARGIEQRARKVGRAFHQVLDHPKEKASWDDFFQSILNDSPSEVLRKFREAMGKGDDLESLESTLASPRQRTSSDRTPSMADLDDTATITHPTRRGHKDDMVYPVKGTKVIKKDGRRSMHMHHKNKDGLSLFMVWDIMRVHPDKREQLLRTYRNTPSEEHMSIRKTTKKMSQPGWWADEDWHLEQAIRTRVFDDPVFGRALNSSSGDIVYLSNEPNRFGVQQVGSILIGRNVYGKLLMKVRDDPGPVNKDLQPSTGGAPKATDVPKTWKGRGKRRPTKKSNKNFRNNQAGRANKRSEVMQNVLFTIQVNQKGEMVAVPIPVQQADQVAGNEAPFDSKVPTETSQPTPPPTSSEAPPSAEATNAPRPGSPTAAAFHQAVQKDDSPKETMNTMRSIMKAYKDQIKQDRDNPESHRSTRTAVQAVMDHVVNINFAAHPRYADSLLKAVSLFLDQMPENSTLPVFREFLNLLSKSVARRHKIDKENSTNHLYQKINALIKGLDQDKTKQELTDILGVSQNAFSFVDKANEPTGEPSPARSWEELDNLFKEVKTEAYRLDNPLADDISANLYEVTSRIPDILQTRAKLLALLRDNPDEANTPEVQDMMLEMEQGIIEIKIILDETYENFEALPEGPLKNSTDLFLTSLDALIDQIKFRTPEQKGEDIVKNDNSASPEVSLPSTALDIISQEPETSALSKLKELREQDDLTEDELAFLDQIIDYLDNPDTLATLEGVKITFGILNSADHKSPKLNQITDLTRQALEQNESVIQQSRDQRVPEEQEQEVITPDTEEVITPEPAEEAVLVDVTPRSEVHTTELKYNPETADFEGGWKVKGGIERLPSDLQPSGLMNLRMHIQTLLKAKTPDLTALKEASNELGNRLSRAEHNSKKAVHKVFAKTKKFPAGAYIYPEGLKNLRAFEAELDKKISKIEKARPRTSFMSDIMSALNLDNIKESLDFVKDALTLPGPISAISRDIIKGMTEYNSQTDRYTKALGKILRISQKYPILFGREEALVQTPFRGTHGEGVQDDLLQGETSSKPKFRAGKELYPTFSEALGGFNRIAFPERVESTEEVIKMLQDKEALSPDLTEAEKTSVQTILQILKDHPAHLTPENLTLQVLEWQQQGLLRDLSAEYRALNENEKPVLKAYLLYLRDSIQKLKDQFTILQDSFVKGVDPEGNQINPTDAFAVLTEYQEGYNTLLRELSEQYRQLYPDQPNSVDAFYDSRVIPSDGVSEPAPKEMGKKSIPFIKLKNRLYPELWRAEYDQRTTDDTIKDSEEVSATDEKKKKKYKPKYTSQSQARAENIDKVRDLRENIEKTLGNAIFSKKPALESETLRREAEVSEIRQKIKEITQKIKDLLPGANKHYTAYKKYNLHLKKIYDNELDKRTKDLTKKQKIYDNKKTDKQKEQYKPNLDAAKASLESWETLKEDEPKFPEGIKNDFEPMVFSPGALNTTKDPKITEALRKKIQKSKDLENRRYNEAQEILSRKERIRVLTESHNELQHLLSLPRISREDEMLKATDSMSALYSERTNILKALNDIKNRSETPIELRSFKDRRAYDHLLQELHRVQNKMADYPLQNKEWFSNRFTQFDKLIEELNQIVHEDYQTKDLISLVRTIQAKARNASKKAETSYITDEYLSTMNKGIQEAINKYRNERAG